jgi:hypothetical protein
VGKKNTPRTENVKNKRLKRFSEITMPTTRSCKLGKKKRKSERKRRGKACG